MGASNALGAFRLYASKVPPLAMNALAYMALVSIDADAEPWFSLGAEMIAVMALGREPLAETGDAKEDARAKKAMEVACERALRPLFDAGAITTARHSSGHPDRPRHAKYRLWLSEPAPDEKRDPRHRIQRGAPYGNRGVQNPAGAESENDGEWGAPHENRRARDDGTLRKPCPRPTESVGAPHGIRGAKEYEEQQEERSKTLEEYPLPSSDSVPGRARKAPDVPEKAIPVRARPLWPSAVPPANGTRCGYADCRKPADPVAGGEEYHETCRYLAAVKVPTGSAPARMQENPKSA